MNEKELSLLTRQQLVALAQEKAVKNYSRMPKAELIAVLSEPAQEVNPEPDTEPAAAETAPQEAYAPKAAAAEPAPQREEVSASEHKVSGLQEAVEEAKYYIGPMDYRLVEETRELPAGYGDNKIVALVRDPHWIYAYWEITPRKMEQAKAALKEDWATAKTVLRVYDITGVDFKGDNAGCFFDIELSGGARNWYIHVDQSNHSFCVDIGLRTAGGGFYTLARSNYVTMPRLGFSEVVDEEWISTKTEAEKIYALSGGLNVGAGSLELRKMLEERLQVELASGVPGSWFAWSGAPYEARESQRGFWFELNTELIVYGATEPGARVTLMDMPIQLRPDGTFSARFALPDGERAIPVTATSPDKVESRTITPKVTRRTE